MDKKLFTVHLPATTANLGPGFDCLGLSLDLWNTITFYQTNAVRKITFEGEGTDDLPQDNTNLIFKTADQYAHMNDLAFPKNIHIHCQNKIPIASGLGSSASAVVGGLVGTRKLLELDTSNYDLLQTAARIEGHADNAAACLFGGLILIGRDGNEFSFRHLELQPLIAVITVPDFSFSTESSRKALPVYIPLRDAVFNITHSINLVQIFQSGNYDELSTAMQDRLHQNYRLPHMPGAKKAIQAANDAEAFGACLSGGGPSVIAFTNQISAKAVGDAMQAAYTEASLNSQTFILECPSTGYYIT